MTQFHPDKRLRFVIPKRGQSMNEFEGCSQVALRKVLRHIRPQLNGNRIAGITCVSLRKYKCETSMKPRVVRDVV